MPRLEFRSLFHHQEDGTRMRKKEEKERRREDEGEGRRKKEKGKQRLKPIAVVAGGPR